MDTCPPCPYARTRHWLFLILYYRWKLNHLYLLLLGLSIYLIRMVISKVYSYSRAIFKSYYSITKNNLIKTNIFCVFLFVINCLLIYFYQIYCKMHLSCIILFNSNYTKSENKFERELDKNITKHYFWITISACMPLSKIILVHYFVSKQFHVR